MRKAALIVNIFLTATLFAKQAYASTFSPATKVNHDGSTAFQVTPRVSFDQNARPICIWRDDRGSVYNIYGSIKTSNGWEEETAVSDSIIDYRGSPDISGPVACWTDHREGYHLYSSIWNGVSWGANVSVNPSASYGYDPSVATSATGKSAVAFEAPGHGWDIFYAEWDGSTWSAIEPVTSSEQTEWQPALAFLGETPFVAWSQPSVGNVLLYSHKDGNAWSVAKEIPTGGWPISNARNPNLISNQDKTKLSIVWLDYRSGLPGKIYIAAYDEASDSFINDQAVTGIENKPSGNPRGAYDSDGNLWVVWSEYKSGEGEQIYYTKRDPSGNWSEISPVSPSEYAQQNPDIDSQGKQVVVVWEQDSIDYLTGRDIYSAELSASPPPKEPILIVPGMMASSSWELITNWQSSWVPTPVLGRGTYLGLIKTLTNQGYLEGKDLYVVYYDWRKPHTEIAERFLKPAIDQAKMNSPTGKVDIVAHSQGGIVSRAYIESGGYEDDVDTLVTVGSPHLGTPKTYYLWEGIKAPPDYHPFMKGLLASFVGWYYWQEQGQLSEYEVNQKYFPSFKELLPVYDFLRDEQGDLINFRSLNHVNDFLVALNSRGDRLSTVHFKNLVGTGFDTAHILNVKPYSGEYGDLWKDGYPIGEEYSDGDGTVIEDSAASEFAYEVAYSNLGHSDLIAKAEGVEKICELLGVEPDQVYEGVTTKDATHFILRSPATILITSPTGKSIGFDPENQAYTYELENAEMVGENEDYKWVTIGNPENGRYLIDVVGTGEGEYHLATIVENEEDYSTKEIQGGTKVGQQDLVEINIDTIDVNNTEIIDPTGQINAQSAETKINALLEIAKKDEYKLVVKKLENIAKALRKGNNYLVLNEIYNLRKLTAKTVSNQNKRVFYKDQLNSIAIDVTETYANTNDVKELIAKIGLRLAKEALEKAEKILKGNQNQEILEILSLGNEKLAEAKDSYEKNNHSRAFILAAQAAWLASEARLT